MSPMTTSAGSTTRSSRSATPNPGGGFNNEALYGNAVVAPEGVQPALPSSPPPFRLEVPCHKNALPAVNGPGSAVAAPDLTPATPVGGG